MVASPLKAGGRRQEAGGRRQEAVPMKKISPPCMKVPLPASLSSQEGIKLVQSACYSLL
ncbi:MAG: hypothetical protein F6K21_04035 [Symploca sp. SIO2D2]|nr:hypothetical protein [Symploca sp. SIO2D2]